MGRGELLFSFDDERPGVFGPVGNLPRNETKIGFLYSFGFPTFFDARKTEKTQTDNTQTFKT
jgi:hypothetical protein